MFWLSNCGEYDCGACFSICFIDLLGSLLKLKIPNSLYTGLLTFLEIIIALTRIPHQRKQWCHAPPGIQLLSEE